MVSGFYSCIFFFHALIILQCICGGRAREISGQPLNTLDPKGRHEMQQTTKDRHIPIHAQDRDNSSQKYANGELGKHDQMSSSSFVDPLHLAANVLFHEKDFKLGNKIPIYFPIKEPSARPPLLSREEADSIPFSSSQLPYLLQLFSFSEDSPQAKAMIDTLRHCEVKPVKGETKFCATSLESMLDSVSDFFGSKTPFKAITTNHLTAQPTSILQNYTIQDEPQVISTTKMMPCHILPYPYAVYYCHGKKSENKLFKVSLVGENEGRVDAAAICHMDTSDWDPNHVAFRVLKTVPSRSSPVCHFFPADNLVWIASNSVLY